ncbi:hypothetical protein NW759_17733 [Fusarium solani]|nr:hypothetical protein NW759_17733 [Fusarium solani]
MDMAVCSVQSRSKVRFVCLGQRATHSRGRRLTCIDCLNQSSMNPIDESTGGSCFGNRLRRKAWWRIRLTAPCSRAWLTSVAYKMTAASAVDRPCWRCGPDDPVARRRASSGPAPFWTDRAVVLTVLLCYADLFRGRRRPLELSLRVSLVRPPNAESLAYTCAARPPHSASVGRWIVVESTPSSL